MNKTAELNPAEQGEAYRRKEQTVQADWKSRQQRANPQSKECRYQYKIGIIRDNANAGAKPTNQHQFPKQGAHAAEEQLDNFAVKKLPVPCKTIGHKDFFEENTPSSSNHVYC